MVIIGLRRVCVMTKLKSEFYEGRAYLHLRKNAVWLRASHDNELLPLYRDICLRISQEAATESTKCFALARAFRLRGE